MPERSEISGEQAWAEAIAYLDRGLPFHAHEVLEQRWRCAPEIERPAWRAAAQWGAALTHAARGNTAGAQRLAARASAGLQTAPCIPEPLDRALVERSCREILAS